MAFELPKLPYNDTDLQPVISAQTIGFHYGKHHKTYVDNLNKLVDGTPMAQQNLEEIITATASQPDKVGIFNNAAQVWNHTFYWNCLKPKATAKPSAGLLGKIQADFGDFENFKKEFVNAALTQFGSGWAWLVADAGKLKVVKTPNAEVPFTKGQKCLLTLDVWEHAYYLDYQNRRADYANAVFDQLINWEFVERNLG
jgi:Fe-Mn family superoxide dismutase